MKNSNEYIKKPLPGKLQPLIDKTKTSDKAPDESDNETEEISKADLRADRAAELKFFREQKFKNHFEIIMILFLWGCAIVFSVVFSFFIWHLLSPEKWQWIPENKLSEIQNFIFGGFGGAAVTAISQHLHKRID